MRSLVNHQLISIAIQPKASLVNKSVIKDLIGIVVTSLYCLFFSTSKNKDLNKSRKVLPL